MRGLKPAKRPREGRATLSKLEAAASAAHTLIRSEPMLGIEVGHGYLRLALSAGHRHHEARALAYHAYNGIWMGVPLATIRGWTDRCLSLAEELEEYAEQGWAHFALGWAEDDGERALESSGRFLELQAEPGVEGASYNRAWGNYQRGLRLTFAGHVGQADAVVAGAVEEAWRRGDLSGLPALAGAASVPAVIVGSPDRGRRELERAREAWPRASGYTLQDLLLDMGEVWTGLFEDAAEADRRLRRSWPTWRRLQLPRGFPMWYSLYGQIALAGARAGEDRRSALSRARGALRAMPSRQQGAMWLHGGHDALLDAAIAAFAGNDERAVSRLEAAEGAFEAKHWPGMVACARHARGGLLGGDAGAALRTDAEAQMRALGAVDLRCFVLMLAPGLWLD